MPRIAISYRRDDTAVIAGRICDRFRLRYGPDSVFLDIDNIPFGIDFRSHIHATLLKTDVLIALIGSKWTGVDEAGAARIEEEEDPVRVEIETALKNQTRILPVLIDGAAMPSKAELPESFGDFAFRNAPDVSSGRDFDYHMDRLFRAIDELFPNQTGGGVSRPVTTSAASAGAPSAQKPWFDDVARYVLAPLILLLAANNSILAFDLNNLFLKVVPAIVALAFGFLLLWTSRRDWRWASTCALGLGIAGAFGMSVSVWLIGGDPIVPQTRADWLEVVTFAATVALSFLAGYALARVASGPLRGKSAKP